MREAWKSRVIDADTVRKSVFQDRGSFVDPQKTALFRPSRFPLKPGLRTEFPFFELETADGSPYPDLYVFRTTPDTNSSVNVWPTFTTIDSATNIIWIISWSQWLVTPNQRPVTYVVPLDPVPYEPGFGFPFEGEFFVGYSGINVPGAEPPDRWNRFTIPITSRAGMGVDVTDIYWFVNSLGFITRVRFQGVGDYRYRADDFAIVAPPPTAPPIWPTTMPWPPQLPAWIDERKVEE